MTHDRNVRDVLDRVQESGVPALVFSNRVVADLRGGSSSNVIPVPDPSSGCMYAGPTHGCEAKHAGWGNNPADAKFLPALMAASVACKGRFRWLLVGDDDTQWCWPTLKKSLAPHDPATPLYFAHRVDGPPNWIPWRRQNPTPTVLNPRGRFIDRHCTGLHCRTTFANSRSPLHSCPALGDRSQHPRLTPFGWGSDPTVSLQDCEFDAAVSVANLTWPYGGRGHILSEALVGSIPVDFYQSCVDRIVHGGCDMRIGFCLGLAGFAPAALDSSRREPWSSHKTVPASCLVHRARAPAEAKRGASSERDGVRVPLRRQ